MIITEINWSRYREFLDMLAAKGVRSGVEIGIYKAKYTEIIMGKLPGIDMTGVDAFKTYKGYKDYEITDLETEAKRQALERAERCHFKVIEDWSVEASRQFADESLDFIFLDSNHDFAHVVEDLAAWVPKVKKGGIVSGHDFFKSNQQRYGVFYAVPAWCEYQHVPELFEMTGDRIHSWYYVK